MGLACQLCPRCVRTLDDLLVVANAAAKAVSHVCLRTVCGTLPCQSFSQITRTSIDFLVVPKAAAWSLSHVCSRPHVIHLHANFAQNACELFLTSWLCQKPQ